MAPYKIAIDGEVFEVTEINDWGCNHIELSDGTEWHIFQDSGEAGEAARSYWVDMAQDDPTEFAFIVGEKTLIAWGLGQSAGPGSTAVNSLTEWLDLWLDVPEEHFGSYDGTERDCRISPNLQTELGLENECVCYRHN